MTLYIKNTTGSNIKYPYKGEVYMFLAGGVSSIDETKLPYSLLTSAYGELTLYNLEQPTQQQIDDSVPAIQLPVVGVSPVAEALISGFYGMEGELNEQRRKYLLLVQAIKEGTL